MHSSNSVPTSVSDRATFPPRDKFKGELWSKKFKNVNNAWTTCNNEYGDFVSRRNILKMDGRDYDKPDDGGPWMASSYQMGYNVKPEFRHKWLDSWQGYVKRKPAVTSAELKEIISPNTYKDSAPPMVSGEGWVDDGPWGSSTYQMGYNIPPNERDPKPIYRFSRDVSPDGSSNGTNSPRARLSVSENSHYNTMKNKNKVKQYHKMRKSHQGVKLPPIPQVPEKARKDIQFHDGKIYMPTPKEKKVEGVNKQFFNFRYRDYWKPLPVYKPTSLR